MSKVRKARRIAQVARLESFAHRFPPIWQALALARVAFLLVSLSNRKWLPNADSPGSMSPR